MIKFIPNLFTLLNLLSGCIAVVFAFKYDLRYVSIMIFISLILDYLDGMAARILNARSPIGKELDSLADLISFGLVPALIVYRLLDISELNQYSYMAFLITVFSAYRLAKFNTDVRQSESFIGLPTPANAIFWSSFPIIIYGPETNSFVTNLIETMSNPYFIVVGVLLFSYLLVAELPLFSLKFKNLSWKDNKIRHSFILITMILFFAFSYYALPFIIILYIIISILQQKLKLA